MEFEILRPYCYGVVDSRASLLRGLPSYCLAVLIKCWLCFLVQIGATLARAEGLEADPVGTGPNEALSKGLASVTKT